ncbi:hypothetical protein FNH06_24945 [Amycolatopsis acidiphila]|uniref:SnoaL-like domain-containing protein n=1 Tax=Amycolatopsis acidiphila TaxID=715473 RepID=A0A558A4W6_9PSEU|nr:hypothetical protein FNH06_24945 [Amycolatopsis acidiphila]
MQDRRQRAHGAVDRLHERLLANDVHGFAAVFAVNGVLELPFGPAALRGREQVREYVRDDITAIVSQTRYDTTDPDVLVVEWEAGGSRHLTVVRVGGGGVELFRDYSGPAAAGEEPRSG